MIRSMSRKKPRCFIAACLANLLETRIAPKLVEHRIKPKQRRSQRCTGTEGIRIGCRHKFVKRRQRAIGLAQL
jgi:hypothetical protein